MKRIFIGSSSESADLAQKAKELLEPDFDVTIWNESLYERSIFKLNKSFLESLLKASLKFDFGILIGTSDDKVVVRKKTVLKPRDNVLFELGLFMGRLGVTKCAFIVEKKLNILSDFQGITLARFEKGVDESFDKAVEGIRDYFSAQEILSYNFFPSSTLASGYFENFLNPVCTFLINNGGVEFEGKTYSDFKIEIIIPSKLNVDLNIQFERLKRDRKTKSLDINTPGRPRKISIDTEIEDNELKIVDFPTTLTGINNAIKNLLPESFSSMDADYELILEREIKRFELQIRKIAMRHGFEDLIEFSHV